MTEKKRVSLSLTLSKRVICFFKATSNNLSSIKKSYITCKRFVVISRKGEETLIKWKGESYYSPDMKGVVYSGSNLGIYNELKPQGNNDECD